MSNKKQQAARIFHFSNVMIMESAHDINHQIQSSFVSLSCAVHWSEKVLFLVTLCERVEIQWTLAAKITMKNNVTVCNCRLLWPLAFFFVFYWFIYLCKSKKHSLSLLFIFITPPSFSYWFPHLYSFECWGQDTK